MNKLLKYCQTGGMKTDRAVKFPKLSKLEIDKINQANQKKEFEKNQTYVSEYKPLNPNVKKILNKQYEKEEFKRKVFNPVVKGLDIVSDIGSMGNFIPYPAAQAIGKFSNILGAGVDLYQATDALKKGDYENALINASSLAIPYTIENPKLLGTFKRNTKYLNPNSIFANSKRSFYLPVDKRYRGMNKKQLFGNRALLGALTSETAYDTQQTGGKNGVIAEAGEFYKDENGQIKQINPDTVTHDDYMLIDEQGNYISEMPYNQGGVAINDAEKILSATHEARDEDANSYTQADEDIRIKPKEGKEFAKRFNFDNIKFNGGSPSKLFNSVLEAKTKKLKKYNNIEYNENSPYGINSSKANGAYIQSLPQDEMIFDEIFDYQESKKQESLSKFMQTGGKGILSPYPEMYGSKPVAMVNIKGKLYPASTVNGRTVSMDDVFNKRDSVELKNFKAIKLNKNERIKK